MKHLPDTKLVDIDKLKQVVIINDPLHGSLTNITYRHINLIKQNDTISFSYTPDDFNGVDKFNIAVIDQLGGAIKTVNLTIKAVDDAATGWTITELTPANEDTTITGIVYANDVDGALKYSIKIQAENGTVEMLNQDTGIWQYEPNTDYHGNDSFTITATDPNGGTSDHEYNLTVEEGNDPTIIPLVCVVQHRRVVSLNPANSERH